MQRSLNIGSSRVLGMMAALALLAACTAADSGASDGGRGGSTRDTGSGSPRDTGGGGGSDTATTDDTGSATDSVSGSDATTTDDTGTTDTTPVVPGCVDTSDCAGLACVNGECALPCATDDNCAAGNSCVGGSCLPAACTTAADCSDGNPCTTDSCSAGVCARAPLFGPVADDPGNCQHIECAAGVASYVEDLADVPPPDRIACTIEQCVPSRGPQSVPNNALCDDGDPFNGDEICSIPDEACISVPASWICDEPDPGYTGTEVCDGSDNNANGQVDEGCPCVFGTTQACFAGAPSSRNVGGCLDGTQTCQNRAAPAWGPCIGGFLPAEEVCDTKDNDCDGCADDIPDCDASLACPTEVTAPPLQLYVLDGPAVLGTTGTGWRWTLRSPPNSAVRGVAAPTAARTTFTPDVSGDYLVSVTFTDDKGNTQGCSWIVKVRGKGLRVEMRWNTFGSVDMDLHLHRALPNTNPWCGGDSCGWYNCKAGGSINWGYANSTGLDCPGGTATCKNPRLDIDNISSAAPENINLDNPRDGETFRVMAHMFSGSSSTNPVITIYCGGLVRAIFGEVPDRVTFTDAGASCGGTTGGGSPGGQSWRVADVTMSVDAATGLMDCTVAPIILSGGYDLRTDYSPY
jgi:hypothetical protein